MSKWGAFYELRDQVNNALKSEKTLFVCFQLVFSQPAIVTDPNASPSTAVTSLKAMYNGCMDTETIEVKLKAILQVKSPTLHKKPHKELDTFFSPFNPPLLNRKSLVLEFKLIVQYV